ncbi:AEC family transporter [Chelativorans sp. AA-79]|uniref:AEC family transporter n=1 Tax=Chelativorans sp. AA-79 TaxID=3028735 RepID=UPI0023F92683|nr:AEC family transporter [Chelativorans sp. AA-79]WEX11452.1 AEC family transporter [Chelativorans sp. AA-79]
MSSLVETVAFVFALVALGYLSGWSGFLKEETGAGLSDFAVSVAVPLLLFRTMADASFADSLPLHLWATYFTAVAVTWVLAQLTIVHVFGRDSRAGVVGGLSGSFSNLALLGIPFTLGIFGQQGFEVLSLILSVHLPIMIAASIVLFSWFGDKDAPHGLGAVVRDFVANVATNPLIIGIVAGLLWRAAGVEMPSLMTRLVDALADVAAPVALFAMGLGLRRYGISGNIRPAIAMAAFKLLLMPVLALLMAKTMGLTGMSAKVVVAAASLPIGVNPYLIATRFGTGQALASNSMSISTALAFFTTAFWLAVAEWAFG